MSVRSGGQRATTPNTTRRFGVELWDERALGYELMAQNVKSSVSSVKELEHFLAECVSAEDTYLKQLSRTSASLHKTMISATHTASSVAPLWSHVLKQLNEHTIRAHLQHMHRVSELIRDVQSYYNELKIRKNQLSEREARTTVRSIEQLRTARSHMTKSKSAYASVSSLFFLFAFCFYICT